MNANLAVNANIGDKLRFPLNYNTQSNLGFDNQIKLDYKGKDDEVIKSIEAGNISYQSKGTLIPSTQNLFGIKAQVQFGKLFITGALANQRSQNNPSVYKAALPHRISKSVWTIMKRTVTSYWHSTLKIISIKQ